jgi:hypothetical protein
MDNYLVGVLRLRDEFVELLAPSLATTHEQPHSRAMPAKAQHGVLRLDSLLAGLGGSRRQRALRAD